MRRAPKLAPAHRALLLALCEGASLVFGPSGWDWAVLPVLGAVDADVPDRRDLARAIGTLQHRGYVLVTHDADGVLVAVVPHAGLAATRVGAAG